MIFQKYYVRAGQFLITTAKKREPARKKKNLPTYIKKKKKSELKSCFNSNLQQPLAGVKSKSLQNTKMVLWIN